MGSASGPKLINYSSNFKDSSGLTYISDNAGSVDKDYNLIKINTLN